MNGNAIEVCDVSKSFNSKNRATTFKDWFFYHGKGTKKREILKRISFNVKKGESVAIIGRNGSGKSTMLKLLSKIMRPDTGTIETDGKIACLIELGAGLHPDMTGRENVYINSSILGLSKKEVDKKMNEILEFSGIGDYFDERVRDYSSGMYLRLAFSIAINVEADILLIDEILAVGDVQFQKKCLDKLNELKQKGTTIVLVTHSTEQAIEFCDRVIWIDDGIISGEGDPATVCDAYLRKMS